MDDTGAVLTSSGYDNNYGFTGRYKDIETDLWYFRARYFDNEMGKFISRDPLEYVDGMSLYKGYFAMGFELDPEGIETENSKKKKTRKERRREKEERKKKKRKNARKELFQITVD